MPKVETTHVNYRGEDDVSVIPFVNYVSNIIGIKNKYSRTKRDINELEAPTRNRKVIKKLIRVEPIYHKSAESIVAPKSHRHVNYYDPNDYLKLDFNKVEESQFIPSNVSANASHRRKMVIIKKKRTRVDHNSQEQQISSEEIDSTEASSKNQTRRRIVVTKKRLIPMSTLAAESIKPTKRIRIVKIKTRVRSNATSTTENTINTSTKETSTENELEDDNDDDYHNGEETQLEPASDDEIVLDEPAVTLPDYEPFFPELSDSLDDPILLLKTTVLSTVHYQTQTLTESRLRTYTYVVTTRVDNGDREHVTSTTEVKPHTKTVTTTLASTEYTTLTLLDLDATVTRTLDGTVDETILHADQIRRDGRLEQEPLTLIRGHDRDEKALDEARYNIATRIMKNGVEVIVAGDKTTYPGGGGHHQEMKRVLPSTVYKPITLKPSTLTNNMMMVLPQDASNIESLSASLYPSIEFVTKTCLTTFTYLTTYLENGTTAVSSHEQVISNVATEERNTQGKILPTPTMGITLTQYPNLAVGTFLTTYTYLNTILDGEQPLVVTSRRVVTNTVTAPDDYLSLLAPNIKGSIVKDTHTYFSTINLEKTLYEGKQSQVIKTNEVLTQVVITESVPPKALSIMTSYIALDVEDPEMDQTIDFTTTDIVKTYYATYTFQNTAIENGNTIVRNNVSVSTDVVTEKLFVHPKRTKEEAKASATVIAKKKDNNKVDLDNFSLEIYATKTYLTTFTYFTTLLQEDAKDKTSTVVSSHSRVVENVITETVDPSSLDRKVLTSLRKEFRDGTSTLVKVATIDGKKIEITAISKDFIKPTKVLPIAKTKMPENSENILIDPSIEPSDPNIITGSTIIFDSIDDPFAATTQKPTPSLKPGKVSKTAVKNPVGSVSSSETTRKKSQSVGSSSKRKNSKRHSNKSTIIPTKSTVEVSTATEKKKTNTKVTKQPVSDLLGLGSINIKALTPVLNAMAGLIQTNLKSNRRSGNVTIGTTTTEKLFHQKNLDNEVHSKSNGPVEINSRSPIYIPVGDIEAAESQNIGTAILNHYDGQHKIIVDPNIAGKSAHASPLLHAGIPISPGELITANSDVIVGKIGRIGPRIPSIPLTNPDEIGMKPPPPPPPQQSNIPWPNRQNQQLNDQFMSSTQHIEQSVAQPPNKDDYLGPPPPQKQHVRPQNVVRGEKHKPNEYKHIPLHNNQDGNHFQQQQYRPENIQLEPDRDNHFTKTEPRPIRFEENMNNFDLLPKDTFHHYQQNPVDIIIPNQLQSSLLNEPIVVLPEVVDRSTGQSLLVNVQPSQITYVNIPHNQSTALIYGDTTELHKNGQYFDDPSPYPQPEFSGIDNFNHNGGHNFASAYNENQNEQQVVGGHIKIGTQIQPININPPSVPMGIRHQLDINPSKPVQYNQINGVHVQSHVNNHDINVHVPPISFGMIQQGNDFNAHIIKHQPPGVQGPLGPKVHNKPIHKPRPITPAGPSNVQQQNNKYRVSNEILPPNRNSNDFVRPFQRYPTNNGNGNTRPNRPNQQQNNRPIRPRPNNEISEFMTPPPLPTKADHNNNNFQMKFPQESVNNQQMHDQSIHNMDHTFLEDVRDDDLTNEAGEVIQESNSRPLVPGQVPIEILKAKTTVKPEILNLAVGNEVFGNRNKPIVKDTPTRPFVNDQGIPISYNINLLNSYKTIPQQYYNNFTVGVATTERSNNIQFPTNPPKYSNQNEVRYTTTEKYVYHVQNVPANYNQQSPNDKNPLTTLLQIDEQNHRITNSDRPKVTSLPINPQVVTTNRPYSIYDSSNKFHGNSQTEQSFVLTNYNTTLSPVFSFGDRDTVPTVPTTHTTLNSPRPTRRPIITTTNRIITPNMELNVGEITKLNYNLLKNNTKNKIPTQEQAIEGLQAPIAPPDTKMQPPWLDLNPANGNVHSVPNQNHNFTDQLDQHSAESSPIPPFVPQPSESLTPPPSTYGSAEVMGMIPPPVTHRKPILQQKLPETTTYRPIYSLELDPPKRGVPDINNRYPSRLTTPYTFETPTTTRATLRPLRTRRPLTRRPTIYRTTTSSTTTESGTTRKHSYWNKPVTPLDFNIPRNRTRRPINRVTTSMSPIAELTTVRNKNAEGSDNAEAPSSKKDSIQLSGSEVVQYDTTSEYTKPLGSSTPILVAPTVANIDTTATNPIDYKTGLHHSSSEVKIITEPTTQSTKRTNLMLPKESKVHLPTRYITHTKTSTVTITKTTVVKSLGSPPSTLTILVTKTEKMTIVDTVTEFHTLVQPTNILEVITTTLNQPSSLYPPDLAYGSSYPSNHQTTPVLKEQIIEPTIIEASVHDDDDDDNAGLNEFVIHDDDDHLLEDNKHQVPSHGNDNESFFVVMTDKNKGSIIKIPHTPTEKPAEPYETQNRDEVINTNEVNRVLLGGILIASPPSLETPSAVPALQKDKCMPECKASRNELCQKMDGLMRCVCRPGFARMFPDRPCKPTYTYTLKLALEKIGKDKLIYDDNFADTNSPGFIKLASTTHNGLDRMVMQSDLRDIYHGVNVLGYQPVSDDGGVYNTFNLQLSDNTDETRLTEVFKKYLRNNNYSLGGTEVFASKPLLNHFAAHDFNECSDNKYHDCSEFAHCFNLRGTYTCSCKEGFADLSENILYPGRICSAELVGCDKCHYHGTCYSIGNEQTLCECFQWYAGENCQINLKVLLIALVTIGTILFTLLLICIIVTCARKKSSTHRNQINGMSFLPPRPAAVHRRNAGGTMDRTAMINDTSSESGQSDTNTLPYVQQHQRNIIIPPPPPPGITLQQQIIGQRKALHKSNNKGLLKKTSTSIDHGGTTILFPDQKDRSLTVMIPRAKYHPAPAVQNAIAANNSERSFADARKTSAASSNEAKLLSYLDAGPSPSKALEQRKYSKAVSDSYNQHAHHHGHPHGNEPSGSRKTSGALISAGFEVSATVGCNNMGTLGTIATTCGTEADRSENATLIQKISHDLLSCSGTQSQFNTIRNDSIDGDDDDAMSNWMDIAPRVMSVSEVRSYDETTIQPPMKTFRSDYNGSKHSSQHHPDEANTMAERDLGSTFLLPHTHLYKADRGSDISGFESL